ncbi:MAG TPA: hypothetical protein PLU39_15095 [Armatimonadota bacterium]|jgi:hypothetical protein|nr:hypothetical protein [Armatimonadota bacterium]
MKTFAGMASLVAAITLACIAAVDQPMWSEPASPYVRRTLFSLPYGEARGQVMVRPDPESASGVEISLRRLLVPDENLLFIQNGAEVWRFNSAGRLLFAADRGVTNPGAPDGKPATAPLDIIHSFAATPEGRLVVVHGELSQQRITEYGATGILQEDAWQRVRSGLETRVLLWARTNRRSIVHVGADAAGHWYLTIADMSTNRSVVALFDQHLRFAGVAPGYRSGWDGSTFDFAHGRESQSNDTLLIYRPGRIGKAAALLRPPAGMPAREHDSTHHRRRPVADVTIDRQG